jgi:predicted enzyme related to lactoylglutathione lyase
MGRLQSKAPVTDGLDLGARRRLAGHEGRRIIEGRKSMTQKVEQEKTEIGGVEGQLAKHGKVSYMEIPALDAGQSAAFYENVFGWSIRDNPGHVSFTDTSGEMIGAFEPGRAIPSDPGVVPYIYVTGIDATIGQIKANGGQIVREPYPEGDLWVATFRDPAGNLMGVWQAGPRLAN